MTDVAPFDVTTVQLGKLAPRNDPRDLQLGNYLDATVLPKPPATLDNSAAVAAPGMLGNDVNGNCVFVGCAHGDMWWTAMAGDPVIYTTDQVVAACNRYGALNGYIIAEALDNWRADPLFTTDDAHKLGAYAAVGPGWVPTAVWLFGYVVIGIELPAAWRQPGVVWDIPDATLDPTWTPTGDWERGSWGGHCVIVVGYDELGVKVCTWGQIFTLTWRAWNTYVSEVYAPIGHDMLDGSGKAPNGFNALQLAADLEQFGPVDQMPTPQLQEGTVVFNLKAFAAEVAAVGASVEGVLATVAATATSIHLPAAYQAYITTASAVVAAIVLAAKDLAGAKMAQRKARKAAGG